MGGLTSFGWIFLTISFATSIFNISILIYFLNRARGSLIEKNIDLNTKEFDLIQRQYILLQAKTDMNTKRIDSIEKVLSVLIASGAIGDGGDGMSH
jgi:hypothetical protein